jgi:6-phosphogluconolactonase
VKLTVAPGSEAAAELAAARMAAAVRTGRHISLAGGTTPRRAYELFARAEGVAWDAVELWFGDERCVPPDDAESNYRLVAESLLAGAPIPAGNVHRVRGEDDPDVAAPAYAAEIRGVVLDLALLGLGEDGHTASLFPGSEALAVRDREAVAVIAAKPPPNRITLTFPVFEAARSIVVLAPGAGKAEAIAAVLRGRDERYPASLLPDRTELITDDAGASEASA